MDSLQKVIFRANMKKVKRSLTVQSREGAGDIANPIHSTVEGLRVPAAMYIIPIHRIMIKILLHVFRSVDALE